MTPVKITIWEISTSCSMSAPKPRRKRGHRRWRRLGGTTSVDVDDERRRRWAARSDTRSKSQDKYDGARPFRQQKTSTESLNSIRCSILSQCSSWRSGVTCSYLLRDKTSRAAVLSTAVCSAQPFPPSCLPFCSLPSIPLEVDPLNPARESGESRKLPKRLPKSILVHFSLKIWHLVATNLMIFLIIKWPNFMKNFLILRRISICNFAIKTYVDQIE